MNRHHRHMWISRITVFALLMFQLTLVLTDDTPSYLAVFFTGITAGLLITMLIDYFQQ